MTILQSLLKNYLPVAVAKTARDPVAARRARFVRALTEQGGSSVIRSSHAPARRGRRTALGPPCSVQ